MNEDYRSFQDELQFLKALWETHETRLSQGIKSGDVETVVNSFVHIYEIFYAVKYNLWKAEIFRKDRALDQNDIIQITFEIIPTLEELEENVGKFWLEGSRKVEKILDRQTERDLYAHLNQNFGSGKYAVNLD